MVQVWGYRWGEPVPSLCAGCESPRRQPGQSPLPGGGRSYNSAVSFFEVIETTGKSIDAQVSHVLTFRNGKLAKFQQYVDTAQLQAVING